MRSGQREQPGMLALGIDAGGTETRWALAEGSGEILLEGRVAGFSAIDLQGAGQARIAGLLEDLAQAVLAIGQPLRVHAGLTGFGGAGQAIADLLGQALGLPASAITLGNDFQTAYLDLFEPGEGYMVYAGTGSIGAFIDAAGVLQRAGGRGNLLDDGGGGFWIAREALRQVWRTEDERPGAWCDSPMARELLAQVGGPDWTHTRQFVYGGSRGDVGRLALAVAATADSDSIARTILRAAGTELARLALALINRYGPRPVALTGRAAHLHPLIATAMREALPAATPFALRTCHGHHAAARLALRAASAALPLPLQESE